MDRLSQSEMQLCEIRIEQIFHPAIETFGILQITGFEE